MLHNFYNSKARKFKADGGKEDIVGRRLFIIAFYMIT